MSLSKDDILNAIAEMSVMDVVELVEAMEEKFGVTAIPTLLFFNNGEMVNGIIEIQGQPLVKDGIMVGAAGEDQVLGWFVLIGGGHGGGGAVEGRGPGSS